MRTALLLIVFAVFCGCSTRQLPSVVSPPKPQAVLPDPIAALVVRLSANETWMNGTYPIIELPSTTATQKVVDEVFVKTGFDRGNVRVYKTTETREVRIRAPGYSSDAFTAVLVETNLGRKIVLLKNSSASSFWWSRVYDAETSRPSA